MATTSSTGILLSHSPVRAWPNAARTWTSRRHAVVRQLRESAGAPRQSRRSATAQASIAPSDAPNGPRSLIARGSSRTLSHFAKSCIRSGSRPGVIRAWQSPRSDHESRRRSRWVRFVWLSGKVLGQYEASMWVVITRLMPDVPNIV